MSELNTDMQLRRANVRIAELEQKKEQLTNQLLLNGKVVAEAKRAVDEAITLTTRMQRMGLTDPAELDNLKKDMRNLLRYFQTVHQNITLLEQGLPAPESGKNYESPRRDIGKGGEQGDTGQEHQTDSGEAPTGVDDTGSAEKQTADELPGIN